MLHGTKFSVPRHLYGLAMRNADAIAQITKDAYNFVFSRCNRDIGLATVVAIGLATLVQEYESGSHRPAAEVMAEVARESRQAEETLKAHDARRASLVAQAIEEFGLERIDNIASALYAAQYEIVQPPDGTGIRLSDPRVNEATRTQYRWAAGIALGADNS